MDHDASTDAVASEAKCDPNVVTNSVHTDKSDDLAATNDDHPNVFEDDVVRSKKTGAIGIVINRAGDSEVHVKSDSEVHVKSDSEVHVKSDLEVHVKSDLEVHVKSDDGNEEEGKEGTDESGGNYQCCVLWMNDKSKSFEDVKDVTIVDRHFSLGDYVVSASEPTGQVGVVVDLNISVDLLAPDGSTHKDISSKKLKRVMDFAVDDYVVHAPSLGIVYEALENVTVLLDDDSKLLVDTNELMPLEPIPYHPGQSVRVRHSKKRNLSEGTVTKVTAGPVFVNWLASIGPDSSASRNEKQSPSVLTLLSSFTHANWRVGDWCRRKDEKVNKKSLGRPLLIVDSRTRVDVGWQDGTVECRRVATTLIPAENPGYDVFVAEQYVVEKAIDDDGDDNNTTEPKRVGVVKSLDAKERTAVVRWLKPLQRAEEPCQFESEETVSVYELEHHPDYHYCYGDVVVRLSPSAGNSLEEATEQGNGDQETKHHQKDEVSEELSQLSWFGNITGLKDGDIEVTWADGVVSKVGPGAVYVVEDDADAAGSGASGDSLEIVEDDHSGAEKDSDSEADVAGGERCETVDDDDSGAPEIAEKDIGRGSLIEGNSDAVTLPLASEDGYKQAESTNASSEMDDPSPQNFGATDNCQSEGPVLENDALEGSKSRKSDGPVTSEGGDSYSFRRFDISQEPLDHHYVGEEEQKIKEKVWVKKVHGDWKLLQDNLPDGIFVRVYEDRMDLLRAVIVGANGTPYVNGVYVFDFHLPNEYPSVPPMAHYHSGGLKLNPNLYEGGNICLSLLNTWQGRGSEVWNPKSSSILQVLVSLQGLVLNAKPYFNEADYDKLIGTVEGEKRSLEYNENVVLLNCKTMMHVMKNQPKGFEELIKEHFRKRASYILKACDAYMEGSQGFKMSLAKIKAKLESALSEV